MSASHVHTDESGHRWLVDDNGDYVRDERGERVPAMHSTIVDESASFRTYNTAQGHCALCGRLGCHGGCFK